jgi:Holliday junction resolvase-like predicted endonuclease
MYKYGHKIELKAKDELIKKGATIVVRSARSLTPIDLIAFFPDRKEIWLIQCKAKKQAPKRKTTLQRRLKDLKTLEGTYTCKAIAYMKQDNKYTFIEV